MSFPSRDFPFCSTNTNSTSFLLVIHHPSIQCGKKIAQKVNPFPSFSSLIKIKSKIKEDNRLLYKAEILKVFFSS